MIWLGLAARPLYIQAGLGRDIITPKGKRAAISSPLGILG